MILQSVHEEVVRSLARDLRKAKDDVDRLEKELENAQSRFSAVADDLNKTRDLAESRRRELKVFENYLTTEDGAAALDVKSGVEELNSLIKHESVNMIRKKFHRQRAFGTECQNVDQYLCIKNPLVNALRHDLGKDESFIIRIALQATFVLWVCEAVSSWGLNPKVNQAFATTYQSIYQSKDQSIAGKWRSLSRAQTPKDNSELFSHFIVSLSNSLKAVFIVAGFDRKDSSILVDGCAEGIGGIVRAALALNQMIGEQITSADFEVYVVRPGTSFDPQGMKDVDRPPEPRKGLVLCTSALGLRRREGMPRPAEEIVMKPEVLVDYILENLRTGKKKQGYEAMVVDHMM